MLFFCLNSWGHYKQFGNDAAKLHLHGAEVKNLNPNFKPGETVTWTIGQTNHKDFKHLIDSLTINDEKINVPLASVAQNGLSETTTMQVGKNKGIVVTVTMHYTGGDKDPTYTIEIKNAKTNLVMGETNLRAVNHAELMPVSLEGVTAYYTPNSMEPYPTQIKLATGVPIAKSSLPSFSDKGEAYFRIFFKLNPGYSNPVITMYEDEVTHNISTHRYYSINDDGTINWEQPPMIYTSIEFRFKDGMNLARIEIEASKTEYSVNYDTGSDSKITDSKKYILSDLSNAKLRISSDI